MSSDPQIVVPSPEMMEPSTLLDATNLLSSRVLTLTERLDISAKQSRRTRVLSVAVAVIVAVVSVFGYVQWSRVSNALDHSNAAIAGNQANAVQLCENSNDSRAANLELWTAVFGNFQPTDPAVETQLDALLAWIALLYQPHDCNDLSRVYCVPPPPDLNPATPPAKTSKKCQ